MQKKFPYALIIILLVILAGYFVIHRNTVVAPVVVIQTDEMPVSVGPSILGDKENFVSFSIAPGASVSGKITATGTITGGYFFEANIIMQILDVNKNVLRTTNGMATTDWMTAGPVSFITDLDFTELTKGAGYVRIHNDNPSGLSENDKYIDVPVVIN